MLRPIHFLSFSGLILLQACQHSSNLEHTAQAKRQRAAFYNTQLGMAYLKQGNRSRSKQKLLTALDLAPNSPDSNAAMAYYLEKTGNVQEARAYYQRALSLAPRDGSQLNNYGTFLCRSGEYKEAINYFAQAVKDIHYLHTASVYENAGLCAAAIPDYAQAEYYFGKALAQDPGRKQSLYELVKIELKQEKAEVALQHLQNYATLFLADVNLLTLGVEAAHKLGKVDEEKNYRNYLNRLNGKTLAEQQYEYHNNNG